jgi:hypothetical protein
MKRAGFVIALLLCLLAAGAARAGDPRNSPCLDCHEADEDAKPDELEDEVLVPAFLRSVHGKLDCVECHVGVSEDHDDKGVTPGKVDCAT